MGDVTGSNMNQQYSFREGNIDHGDGRCLIQGGRSGRGVVLGDCPKTSTWEEIDHEEPPAARIYRGNCVGKASTTPFFQARELPRRRVGLSCTPCSLLE